MTQLHIVELLSLLKLNANRHPDYSRQEPFHSVVLECLDEYCKTGKFPYNRDVAKYIIAQLNLSLSIDEEETLNTMVYFAQEKRRRRIEAGRISELEKVGWHRLTLDAIQHGIDEQRHLRVLLRGESIFGAYENSKVCRPIACGNGELALLPPRSRVKGYAARGLCDPTNEHACMFQYV